MFIDTKERPAGEVQQKVGRLRLSEAIRIGAKLRPQITNGCYRDSSGTCAIGAAFEATGIKEWYSLAKFVGVPTNLHIQITSRNDRGESRESIADWLQSQGL